MNEKERTNGSLMEKLVNSYPFREDTQVSNSRRVRFSNRKKTVALAAIAVLLAAGWAGYCAYDSFSDSLYVSVPLFEDASYNP